MTILTHHSNEAWDVFLTLPSHRQTTARKCNSVLVNSPGWRYDNEHKKAKVTLGILLPVYTLTGKIKWKTTSTLSESYKYTHLPEFDQMVLQPKNRIEGKRRKKGKTPQSNYQHPVDPGYTYFPLYLGWLVLCWFWCVVCDQQQQHHLGASEKPVNLNGIRSITSVTEYRLKWILSQLEMGKDIFFFEAIYLQNAKALIPRRHLEENIPNEGTSQPSN